MNKQFLKKLKDTIVEGATFSAAKAEEAAKKGKLHLDIITEKRKLGNKFENLGMLVFKAIEEGTLENFSLQSSSIELLGEIKVLQDKIEELTQKTEQPAQS